LSVQKSAILLRYYRTSAGFLFLTALSAAVLFGMRVFGIFAYSSFHIALVHLGILGAFTLGMMGLYLRIFYSLESVVIQDWIVKAIHIVLSLGVLVLILGFGFSSWPILVIGVLGVYYAGFWWAFQYLRWYLQAEKADRKGVLLFGGLATLALIVSLLLGGYLLHGFLTNSVPQNMRLAHIHAGLVGWASLGLLGIGVALRGGDSPVTGSVKSLQGSAWIWFAGAVILIAFFAVWKLRLVLVAGAIVLLGFIGYGYSMPKVGKLATQAPSGGSAARKLLPFILIGFLGLFLTILLGFDMAANYPSGRVGAHRLLGVGGWLLLTFLMSLLSEIPQRANDLLEALGGLGEVSPPAPGLVRAGWIGLTVSLLVALAGSFTSQVILFIGVFLLSLITAFLAGYLVVAYRVPVPRVTTAARE